MRRAQSKAVSASERCAVPPSLRPRVMGSACVSYMPEGVALRSVVGLGMNLDEMKANDDLTERVVHDLNANPSLPFDDNAFDAVVCASALQYLTQPELVLQMLCV